MRVLVFGESTTQGFWDTEGGWVQRLRKDYDTIQVSNFDAEQPRIMNLSISGATTGSLLGRFEQESKVRKNEKGLAFIFSTGGNSASIEGDKPLSTPEEYEAQLEELIDKAKKFSDKIMFVGLTACDEAVTNPVSWANFSYTNNRRLVFENVMQSVCAKYSLPSVAILEKFQEHMKNAERLLCIDGLHPNNNGHEFIFQEVKPELDKLLNT